LRKAPEAADFRSPMPQAPVVDSRSRTRPVSAAQPWERSRTLLPWRSPRVMQAPEQVVAQQAQPEQEVPVVPVVPEPVALVGRVAPAAVRQVVPVAAVPQVAVQLVVRVVPEPAAAVRVVPEPVALVVQVAAVLRVQPAVEVQALPEQVAPEPVA
jgi:hypothetical protein